MKSFEKPVVVLNEMLMNESIAAACCFTVKNGVNTALGGSLVPAGSTKSYSIHQDILSFFGASDENTALLPSGHQTIQFGIYYDLNEDGWKEEYLSPAYSIIIKPGALFQLEYLGLSLGAGLWDKAAGMIRFGDFGDSDFMWGYDKKWTFDGSGNELPDHYILGALTNPHCDHGDETCPWVITKTNNSALGHIGSAPHLFGGTKWNVNHTATQFNS